MPKRFYSESVVFYFTLVSMLLIVCLVLLSDCPHTGAPATFVVFPLPGGSCHSQLPVSLECGRIDVDVGVHGALHSPGSTAVSIETPRACYGRHICSRFCSHSQGVAAAVVASLQVSSESIVACGCKWGWGHGRGAEVEVAIAACPRSSSRVLLDCFVVIILWRWHLMALCVVDLIPVAVTW